VVVRKVQGAEKERRVLDVVELSFKDQFIGRADLWRFKLHLSNSCVYFDKKLTFSTIRVGLFLVLMVLRVLSSFIHLVRIVLVLFCSSCSPHSPLVLPPFSYTTKGTSISVDRIAWEGSGVWVDYFWDEVCLSLSFCEGVSVVSNE
jgi:hypothetical protein